MSPPRTKPVWRKRYKNIDRKFDDLRTPRIKENLSQDEEWCLIVRGGKEKKIRLHDYHLIYNIPGAYEELFYNNLKCCSPSYVTSMLQDVMLEAGEDIADIKVFDVGAGNGMVADELSSRGVKDMIGIDLIPEAKDAAYRDRPGLYKDYIVADLEEFPAEYEEQIRKSRLNCLVTVAALGFGDLPPLAFLKALELLQTPSWVALNLNENFIKDDETSGFNRLVRSLCREEYIVLHAYRRYKHRLSIHGNPIYYVAMVARKVKPIPDALLEEWKNY